MMRMGQTHVHRYLDTLLSLVEQGKIDPSFVISHHLSLEDGPAAYELFLHDKDACTKVVLRPSHMH